MTAHRYKVAATSPKREHTTLSTSAWVISTCRPCSVRDVAEARGISNGQAADGRRAAVAGGELLLRFTGRAWRYVDANPSPIEAVVRKHLYLTPMRLGPGPRRDCGRDDECLRAMLKNYENPPAVHCPADCPRFVPPATRSGWQTGEHPIAKLQRLYGVDGEED